MNVSQIVRAALTGHTYAGRCPDNGDPAARDATCPSCRVLMEAEGLKRDREHKWERLGWGGTGSPRPPQSGAQKQK